jgi:SAM-dependent methyltransferase
MSNNQQINSCLITGEPVKSILDLGMHPYADTFIGADQQHLSEPILPLRLNLCDASGMIQLDCVSNDWDRYNLYSYSYTSSNGAYSRRHWQQLAQDVRQKTQLTSGRIVEIGSNDGYLLSQFQPDFEVLGVDASDAMCELSRQRDVPVEHGIFGQDLAATLAIQGTADVILANNVVNHANNPLDFVRGVKQLLSAGGWFVFEVPNWSWMMSQGRWDMIYHEHVSYFTVTSLFNLLARADLVIQQVEYVDFHGESLRIWAQHVDDTRAADGQLLEILNLERAQGLFDQSFYKKFAANMQHQRHQFLDRLLQIKLAEPDRAIIGVGAAAKANTWLNYHGVNHLILDWVTDASPQKQGKYTPLSRIPIVGDDIFAQYQRPIALILSWNISQQLRDNLLSINKQTEFINI